MRQIAYSRIEHLSYEFSNPMWASRLMREYMSKAIRLTKDTMTKDVLMKFRNSRVGFREVHQIAEQMVGQFKSSKLSKSSGFDIVKDLMKYKMYDALNCVKESKDELKKTKDDLDTFVRKGTFVREEFMDLVNREVNHIWNNGKEKNKNKVDWAVHKRTTNNDNKTNIVRGVIVGDTELERFEKETNENKTKKENRETFGIYDNIKVTKDQEEILKLPPGFKTFPKLKVGDMETELEKCMIKATWEENREMRKNEMDKVNAELAENAENVENAETVEVETDGKKNLDLKSLKATDLKNNKRVIIQRGLDDESEIKRNYLKGELKDVFVNYMKEHCDKHGNMLENNLDVKQMETIKKLKKKMQDENLVCYKTDKTGNLVLDTINNYSNKMSKHIKEDEAITEKKVKSIENNLNKHANYWVEMTKAGELSGQQKRIKGNLKTKDNQIPLLSGTSKDHKVAENATIGPDVRPIMGAMVGPNIGLSNFGSIIVKAIANEFDVGHVSKSTEETIAKIEEYNSNRENLNVKSVKEHSKVIIGSMDIDKWYPNTIPEPSAKTVREMYENSSVEIGSIDFDKVSKYLGDVLTENEIKEEGFEEIVYIKVKKVKQTKNKEKKKKIKVTKNIAKNNVKKKNVQKKNKTSANDDGKQKNAHKIVGEEVVNKQKETNGKESTLNTNRYGGGVCKE